MLSRIRAKLDFKLFFKILAVVAVLSFIGINSDFYEDKIYINYVKSILQDQDFNIINQAPLSFSEVITKKYATPAHHSVIETPSLVVLSALDWAISVITGKTIIAQFQLAGLLLSFLSLLIGFLFTGKAAELIGVDLKPRHFVFFVLTTTVLYFSFFMITVMEIFTFCLSSYVFYSVLLIQKKKAEQLNAFAFGVAAAMLVVTKITFLPLFLISLFYAIKKNQNSEKRITIYYIVGALLVGVFTVLKDYATFGEIVLISRAMNEFTTRYELAELYLSLTEGFFGKGGLFYTSPLYLLGFAGFISFVYSRYKSKQEDTLLLLALLGWLFWSFFQTIFIIGPMLEDHYVGRLQIMSLPLMLIGLAFCDSKINIAKKKMYTGLLLGGLICWQAFTLLNFLALSAISHYSYALSKTVPSTDIIYRWLESFLFKKFEIMGTDGFTFTLFIFAAAFILYFLVKNKDEVYRGFHKYLIYAVVAALLFTMLDAFNSKKNGEAYLVQNNILDKVTIADHYSAYSYIYMVDILRSQRYTVVGTPLEQIIKDKQAKYLRDIKPHFLQMSPEFKQALEGQNLDYGPYR